ncbi:MAG: phage minor tail protein L [Azoarcus sp.]|jgi:lambda family phage minor tail protein L|nr:phage minor tail protein L [Azoarcus sp.]
MITADLQSLTPGTIVELFDLDTTRAGDSNVYRFHNGVNELGNDVTWNGYVYTRLPIEASGFERRSSGTLPRPKIKVANADGLLGALVRELDDLAGARLTRTRTLLKYLDAVNFPDGNPTADAAQVIDREVWEIDRKSAETPVTIEFELAAAIDVNDYQLPGRQVIQNTCTWLMHGGYRGPYCGYTGGPVADEKDQPVETMAADRCAGRLASCKLRFGEFDPLPFGGCPGVGLLR